MPRKIFIVDDADFVVDTLRLILESAGHKVVGTAASGADALDLIKRLPAVSVPDVVTVDFHMPKMDGLETIRKIRMVVPNVRVLLVSSHATFPIAMKAKEMALDGFIVKPFEPSTVLQAIDKLS